MVELTDYVRFLRLFYLLFGCCFEVWERSYTTHIESSYLMLKDVVMYSTHTDCLASTSEICQV